MRKVEVGARVFLGLIFTVFGLNGFFTFLPIPEPEGEAGAVLTAFGETGYLMPLVFLTEAVCGVLLLANRFVALALVLIAPVIVNIVLFHLFVDRAGLGIALVVVALDVFLAYSHKESFRPILSVKP